MFGRFALLAVLAAVYQRHGAAYWASAQGQRMARDITRLVFTNIFFVATMSLVATKWELFWLHIGVAVMAIPMYAARGWRPALAVAAGDWGFTGDPRAAEYLARAIASLVFLIGWWNLMAPTPALNFHAHPYAGAFLTVGVWLFILRKEFVSQSLKETPFFKWSTALVAGAAFAVLLVSRAVPIVAAVVGHFAAAPAGSTAADAAVVAATLGAERSALVANAAERAAYHMADISWPRSQQVEVSVPAGTRVDASVKLANDMPARVTVTGPAGSTVTVGLFDRSAGTYVQAETVGVGKPIDLHYLGLRPAEVWVDGDPTSPTRVLLDRGTR